MSTAKYSPGITHSLSSQITGKDASKFVREASCLQQIHIYRLQIHFSAWLYLLQPRPINQENAVLRTHAGFNEEGKNLHNFEV